MRQLRGTPTAYSKKLINAGANIHAIDNKGRTPLHHAAKSNYTRPETLSALIDAGAKINEIDKEGNTSLHEACSFDATDNIRILLAYGADINALNNKLETPLYIACSLRGVDNEDSIRLLLAAGADTTLKNSDGKNVRDITDFVTKSALSAASKADLLVDRFLGKSQALLDDFIVRIRNDVEMAKDRFNSLLAQKKLPPAMQKTIFGDIGSGDNRTTEERVEHYINTLELSPQMKEIVSTSEFVGRLKSHDDDNMLEVLANIVMPAIDKDNSMAISIETARMGESLHLTGDKALDDFSKALAVLASYDKKSPIETIIDQDGNSHEIKKLGTPFDLLKAFVKGEGLPRIPGTDQRIKPLSEALKNMSHDQREALTTSLANLSSGIFEDEAPLISALNKDFTSHREAVEAAMHMPASAGASSASAHGGAGSSDYDEDITMSTTAPARYEGRTAVGDTHSALAGASNADLGDSVGSMSVRSKSPTPAERAGAAARARAALEHNSKEHPRGEFLRSVSSPPKEKNLERK